MPYVDTETRELLDGLLDSLIEALPSASNQHGALAYIIDYLIMNGFQPSNFTEMMQIVGTLEAEKLTFMRHHLGPLEDLKLEQNGPTQTDLKEWI